MINRSVLCLLFSVLCGSASAQNQTINGTLTVTGSIEADGQIDTAASTLTFGTQGSSFGAALLHQDNSTDTFTFLSNRNPASWLWQHTVGIAAMRLDSTHQLILYQADGTTAGVTLTPASNAIKLGTHTNGTLTADANGVITAGGGFAALGGITNASGSLTGGTSGLTLNAGGTNQSITLNSSGGDLIFSTSSTERMRIMAGGNVGIGTSSPTSKLHISGVTPAVRLQDTAAGGVQHVLGAAGGVFGLTADAGNAAAGSRAITFNLFNTEYARLNASGNFGVGTSSPQARWHVFTSQGAGATTELVRLTAAGGGNTSGTASRIAGYSDVINGYIDFKRFVDGGPTTGLVLGTFGGDVLTIRSAAASDAGSVGIGTTSPSERLHLYGGRLKIQNTANGYGWLYGEDINHSIILRGDRVGTVLDATNYHQYGGSLADGTKGHRFWTGGVLAAQVERMRIANDGIYMSGNIGIGTNAPSSKLDIETASGANTPLLELRDMGINVGFHFEIGDTGIAGLHPKNLVIRGDSAVSDIAFSPSSSYPGTLTINGTTGNVGIGTTAPAAKLEVGGTGARIVVRNTAEDLNATFVERLSLYARSTGPDAETNEYGSKLSFRSLWGSTESELAYIVGFHDYAWKAGLTIAVKPQGNGQLPVPVMTFRESGNVGVGTTAPTEKLEVAGNLKVSGTFTAANYSASGGSITGGPTGLTLNAGGASQNLVFAPSNAGNLTGGQTNVRSDLRFGTAGSAQTYYIAPATAGGAIQIKQDPSTANRWLAFGMISNTPTWTEYMRIADSGNVGIGTTNPNYKLDVNGDAQVSGGFRLGELYFSPLQTIGLAIGPERWIKLATIPNNHYVRFQLRSGSQNSEEIAEVKVFGTYYNSQTGISVERQTYNDHLREVRIVGSDGGSKTVYIKIRASDYAPSVAWRAMDSKGAITIHNTEETPSGGMAHFVSGNLVTSTNTNITTTGNVGIGTTAPVTRVEASMDSAIYWTPGTNNWGGSLTPSQALTLTNTKPGGYDPVLLGRMATSAGVLKPTFAIGAVGRNSWADGDLSTQVSDIYFVNRDSTGNLRERMRIDYSGNVGIGTATPTHPLSVKGTIRAQEIIVDNTNWADYVFEDDYRLTPLAEVEQHIREKKHLPGIPSASEVAQHGVSMGEMQARLLSKVEELTLHMIEQEKRNNVQQAEIATLRAELSQMKAHHP